LRKTSPPWSEPAESARAYCAILAAGRSSRMGEPKLLLPLDGAPLVARALAAAAAFPRVIVASPALATRLTATPGLTIVINDAPERGMAHSLALADAAVADRRAALVVLLGDTPLVDAALIARLVRARGEADVAYPVRAGVPGHPVVFGPRPRAEIAALPDGDTLRHLRADPRWSRVEVPEAGDRPFLDVDTPEDLARVRRLVEPGAPPANS
jgi:CTP:molybdopterin cytidylyltransferase MocA